MAAPSVAATATTAISTAASSHAVNLPSVTSADKGKMFVMFMRTGANQTMNVPSGWTRIGEMSNEASQHEGILWKRVVGNEGATVTCTFPGTTKAAYCVFLINGAADPNSKNPDNLASTAFTGTANTHPDPGIVTMSPTCDALYIAWASWVQNSTVSTYPTGYTSAGYVTTGTAASTDCSIACPWKQTTGSSADNPGQYTISASRTWTARTMGIFPGNYLAATVDLGGTRTVAAITSKLASVVRNFGPTISVNAQKQFFAVIQRNFGPTIQAAALTTLLASLSRNLGMTITVNAVGTGDKIISANISLGPNISAAAERIAMATITEALGPTATVVALGGGFMRITVALGPTTTVGAGRIVTVASNILLGLYDHICAWVNPKFLRPFSEDTGTATAQAEDTGTATAQAEDPFSVVVLAEVNMNLTAEAEDTLLLTTETEETTEC
jgi:hypothetical protein